MKRIAAVLMLAGFAQGRSVTVCVDHSGNSAIASAMQTASELFAGIGVDIDWRPGRSCPESLHAIKIAFNFYTRADVLPGALAHARVFEGTHIEIFYNRVEHTKQCSGADSLLAYVLAHEITHMLQAVNHHSKEGIMKANWSPDDFAAMDARKPGFTADDADLVSLGLQSRARRPEQTAALTNIAR